MKLPLALVLLACFMSSAAQVRQTISITGDIADDENAGINDCNVKISSIKQHLILAYFSTGSKNNFEKEIKADVGDTIRIALSHTGYRDTIIQFIVSETTKKITFSASLQILRKTLSPVTINAPGTWTRGDTTFYRADAYREGNELKLKDLITKVPGFTLTEDGILKYNDIPVDKILIDGQDMFADKQKLLLNNIPTHAINTIMAIKNQNDNKLLQGLSGSNRLVVNLGLKKNHHTSFGSGDAGLGTKGRYNFNPVFFALANKVKVAYIGNFNSLGKGVDWSQENELKNSNEVLVDNLLFYNHPLQILPYMPPYRYIRNNSFDNRVKINSALSAKVSNETEIDLLKDNQRQHSFYQNILFGATATIFRNDSNNLRYSPLLIKIENTITIQATKLSEMKISASYFGDYSTARQQSTYSFTGSDDRLNEKINTNRNSIGLDIAYTKRKSISEAISWTGGVNHQIVHQNAEGISGSWPALFNTDPTYTSLVHRPGIEFTNAEAGWSLLAKRKKNLYDIGIKADWVTGDIDNVSVLRSTDVGHSSLDIDGLINRSHFSRLTLAPKVVRKFIFASHHALELQSRVGVESTSLKETGQQKNVTTPLVDISMNNFLAIGKLLSNNTIATFGYHQLNITDLPSVLLPVSINSYRARFNTGKAQTKVTVNSNFNFVYPGNISSSNVGVSVDYSTLNPVMSNNFQQFILVHADSFTHKPVHNIIFFTSHYLPSAFLKALILIQTQVGQSQYLLRINDHVVPVNNNYLDLKLTVRKNWNRKYILAFTSRYMSNHANASNGMLPGLQQSVQNVLLELNQKVNFSARTSMELTTSWFRNNISSPDQRSWLFADISFYLKMRKKPISLVLKADNLTNVKRYYSFYQSPGYQSYYTVPFTPASVFLSVVYEF
ncbi:MAG: hypothetical protein ABI480_04580 [Chitinophagaceae bacterium]